MKQMEDAKKRYEEIPIPEELSERVQEAIALSSRKHEEEQKVIRLNKNRTRKAFYRSLATAAAVTAAFTIGLNTSTAFAETAGNLPVIGSVARLLTFRSYENQTEDMGISVEIPSIEMIESETGFEKQINQEIYDRCEAWAKEAVARAEEYRKAFLETGGTEEEWKAHNIQIKVGYELKAQTEDTLSFVVRGTENWTTAYSQALYYNLDLKNHKMLTLKDLLGEDYKQKADDSIQAQIKEKEAQTGVTFFTPEEGGFTGITEDTSFYINEQGNPVIVFEKYEIAPGAAGEVEFEIPLG